MFQLWSQVCYDHRTLVNDLAEKIHVCKAEIEDSMCGMSAFNYMFVFELRDSSGKEYFADQCEAFYDAVKFDM